MKSLEIKNINNKNKQPVYTVYLVATINAKQMVMCSIATAELFLPNITTF